MIQILNLDLLRGAAKSGFCIMHVRIVISHCAGDWTLNSSEDLNSDEALIVS